MSGPAQPCRWCKDLVVVRQTLSGKPRPFDRVLQSPEELPETLRWVPQRGEAELVMVRVDSLNPARLVGVRWYAVAHECAPFLRSMRESRDPSGLGDLQEQLLEHFGLATAKAA